MAQVNDSLWFVAQLRPQGLARAQVHLGNQGFQYFAPEMQTSTIKAGVARQVRKPLFPGYLFVSFDPSAASWTAINSTRGIARLIATNTSAPTPLPAALIAGLRARCDASGLLLPPANLEIGDRIRVLSGPFADLVTTIETLPGAQRIGVLVDLMGRKVRTSLPRDQVEKMD